jgi:hypothetical protein
MKVLRFAKCRVTIKEIDNLLVHNFEIVNFFYNNPYQSTSYNVPQDLNINGKTHSERRTNFSRSLTE